LTPIDTVYSLDENSVVSIDISDIVNTPGEYSFALGVLDEGDSVSFYSKEKMYCANNYPGCNESDQPGGAEPYAPLIAYWPSLTFEQDIFSNNEKELLPFKFALYQNYPNPFNPITTIDYEVARDGLVSIFVYDLMGRRIKTLVNKVNAPGRYSVSWNGSNDDSKQLSTGMYFYKMRAEGFESVKKLMLIK
jgi:hypothetical protein